MELRVREARAGGARRVRDIHVEPIEELGEAAYDGEQVGAWAHDRDPEASPIGSEETRFLVAEDAGEVVGFGWMELTAGEYFDSAVDGEITAIYVQPSVARHGVGSRICEGLETSAVRNDVESPGLWTSGPRATRSRSTSPRGTTASRTTLSTTTASNSPWWRR